MKKLIALIFTLVLVGCKTIPVPELKSEPVGYNLTQEQVKNAIVDAGYVRNWQITPVNDNLLRGTLNVRSHMLEVDIPYSAEDYSILYYGSENLKYKDGKIHKKVATWVRNLNLDIKKSIREAAAK
ncbi:hypothetical protein G3R49_05235 [Shewanella sp. WXL01]|uniref:Lipoprotein n=1 Tax=Shewanella maritima TaxID=2520507 RepID=A0A411PEU3_9GAMM|nr:MULTISPECIES: hypothetical protein [Shewanella]NKF49975.1 hypothetical protein [Shewanella sp. WXL01]QBF81972.1 hypothetical protein EXU30_04110 [Shewanella maritima]